MKSNTIYPPMSEREISGAAISREAATQGMVLLKNINGVLLTAVFPAVVIRMWISLCVIILIF